MNSATASIGVPSVESPAPAPAKHHSCPYRPAAVAAAKAAAAANTAGRHLPNNVDFSTGNARHVPLCGISNVTASTVPAKYSGYYLVYGRSTAPNCDWYGHRPQ